MQELPSNTFRQDFLIAERLGEGAIRDTFNRCEREWIKDPAMFAAFVVTLNHRIWDLYKSNEQLARVYNELWDKANTKAWETFKDEDARLYFQLTD